MYFGFHSCRLNGKYKIVNTHKGYVNGKILFIKEKKEKDTTKLIIDIVLRNLQNLNDLLDNLLCCVGVRVWVCVCEYLCALCGCNFKTEKIPKSKKK